MISSKLKHFAENLILLPKKLKDFAQKLKKIAEKLNGPVVSTTCANRKSAQKKAWIRIIVENILANLDLTCFA